MEYHRALIAGSGEGLSASLARIFAAAGMKVTLAARETGKLAPLCKETGAAAISCDVASRPQVETLFAGAEAAMGGSPDVVVFNASARARGAFADLDPEAVERAMQVNAMGGFNVARAAVHRMLPCRHGAILFTGASASVKGYARSAPFAMGKFALRGLAQSLARELAPEGIHVAHFVIDGQIRNSRSPEPAGRPDSTLDPDAIAANYLHVLRQARSAWTWEMELRPWVETF